MAVWGLYTGWGRGGAFDDGCVYKRERVGGEDVAKTKRRGGEIHLVNTSCLLAGLVGRFVQSSTNRDVAAHADRVA